ncbi:hypothetical protein Tco_1249384 [Tanacetum coccineum]
MEDEQMGEPVIEEVAKPGLVQRLTVSDAEVAAGVTIRELGPRVYVVEGQVQVMVSQMAHAKDRWEQVGAQVKQIRLCSRETPIQIACILDVTEMV